MVRRTTILVSIAFLSGAVLGSWLLQPVWAQARRTALQTTNLKQVDLGSWCPGKEATVQLIEFGPGTSGRHYHPAHSFAFVVDGSETQTIQGGSTTRVKAGELLYDGPGEVHETQNTAPVKVLVVRIIEKGKEVTTQVP